MSRVRLALYVVIALLVTLLGGFLWGRAGQSALQAQLDATGLRLDLDEARGNLLAARIDLFEVNFGRASQRLEAAKTSLRDAAKRLSKANRQEGTTRINDVLARVQQAQQQVGRLDQSSNTRLGDAVALLDQQIAANK